MEVLVVFALLALFAGAVGPVYRSVQTKNNLDSAVIGSVSAIRRAQASAESGNGDSNWGVKITDTSATVFAGSSYATRQTSYDEKLDFPGATTISGNSEIIFAKFTGLPQTIGTTTIANPFGSKNLVINEAGTITY